MTIGKNIGAWQGSVLDTKLCIGAWQGASPSDIELSHTASQYQWNTGSHNVYVDVNIQHTSSQYQWITGNHVAMTEMTVLHTASQYQWNTGSHSVSFPDVTVLLSNINIGAVHGVGPYEDLCIGAWQGNIAVRDVIARHTASQFLFTTGTHTVDIPVGATLQHTASWFRWYGGSHRVFAFDPNEVVKVRRATKIKVDTGISYGY